MIDFLFPSLKRGLFLLLFGAGSGLSYLGIQKLINERDEIMHMYWRELLGKEKFTTFYVDLFYFGAIVCTPFPDTGVDTRNIKQGRDLDWSEGVV